MDGSTGLRNGKASETVPECDHCQMLLLLGQFIPACVATKLHHLSFSVLTQSHFLPGCGIGMERAGQRNRHYCFGAG